MNTQCGEARLCGGKEVSRAMASVKKGVPAARSLPVNMEKSPAAPVYAKSFHSQRSEMSDFTSSGQIPNIQVYGDSASEESGDEVAEQAGLVSSPDQHRSYGATTRLPLPPRRRRKRKASAISIASITRLFSGSYESLDEEAGELGYEESDEEEEEEDDPPIMSLIYRRSRKDKCKLITIPMLYIVFMMIAGAFAFYSIQGLILSYKHRVRSVRFITVDEYHPIGIVFFPEDFATYDGCGFKYNDELAPVNRNWTRVFPSAPQNCTYVNVTFHSTLIEQDRKAMVFRGPTLVHLKQSLALYYSVNTTLRNYSAIEYMLFEYWDEFISLSPKDRSDFLTQVEEKEALYTVPGGFRTWVKLSYILRNDGSEHSKNSSDFTISADFSKYNDWRNISDRTTDVVYALFEWKSDTFEYISEILSTNVWNTLGGLAGVFVTMIKAGEYCTTWIRRIRRERKKKKLKLKEMEEEQERMLDEYRKQREEKKFMKQKKSMVATDSGVQSGGRDYWKRTESHS